MPVLAAEPTVFPATLLETEATSANNERQWSVLHVRPRQEKALARGLRALEVPFYLPTVSRRLRIRGRIVTSQLPLFPGYVFLHGDRDQRLAALGTQRIVRTLPVVNQGGLWLDLRQIDLLIRSGAPITPEDRLQPGMAVEIRSGPLAGLKGTILRCGTGRRFIVAVDFIQRGASVELDDCCLTSVD